MSVVFRVFSGLRFVEMLERVTGALDTEQLRYIGHSEQCLRRILTAEV